MINYKSSATMRKSLLLFFVFLFVSFAFSQKGNQNDQEKPEDNRFTPVTLTPEASLDEPMMFQVLKDESVYIVERKGGLKRYDPVTGEVQLVTTIPVHTGSEQGLMGIELDPNYETNHWAYIVYSHAVDSIYVLERYDLFEDKIDLSSKKRLLEFPIDRGRVNHPAGGMTWDKEGNLYITTPNNTGNQLLAQVDEREGFSLRDDQRTSANTNDLRGKILRIHPEPDGTYTIPEGNLFPVGMEKTRPEIYTMGLRNPWRVSVDSKTGWVYWGEIGPDKDVDDENSPRGYDEFNQAKGPGFFGWPYFIGNNIAYPMYDFATNTPGPKQDPAHPINNSPNNTGLNELPPAQPAMIWYPYAESEEFPLVGSSSRCAVGGPIYHRSDFDNPERPLPAYYEGKWLAADYSRFWIMAITMDENGNYKSMERFAPNYHPVQQIDLKFGPTGDLYVLEYGSNTSKSAVESKLVRIEYNEGNRRPVVKMSASKKGGAIPFETVLSSEGTIDYDGDALKYEWVVTGAEAETQTFTSENPKVSFTKAGIYQATLTVTDPEGLSNSSTIQIIAGNEEPIVTMNLTGNKTFFFDGSPLIYNVTVSDKEDGSLADGRIVPSQVAIGIDYASEGLDFIDIFMNHQDVDASIGKYTVANALMQKNNCNSCHNIDTKVIGPSFMQIVEKYGSDPSSKDKLIQSIRGGSSGIWSNDGISMPAHPSLSANDAGAIVDYILNLGKVETSSSLPVSGSYIAQVPEGDNGRGSYILRAAYQDKAQPGAPSQTIESLHVLKSPILLPNNADTIGGGALRDQMDEYVYITAKSNSYIGYKDLDLTNIKQVELKPNWHIYNIYKGGTIEIRLDSPTGELLGQTVIKPEQFNSRLPGALVDRLPSRNTDRNANIVVSKATIKEVSGVHNIYFVFKNAEASESEPLFPLFSIKFNDQIK